MTLSFFTDLFQQDFLFRAMIAGVILGIIAPLLGSIVVIRRLSFIADTLGHFSLVGISVSLFLSTLGFPYFLDHSLYLGIFFSVVGGLMVELFRRSYKNYKEISMVIVISLGAALSAIFFSLSKKTGSLFNYLFGSILTITNDSVWLIFYTAILVGLLFLIFGKQIIAVSFEEHKAKLLGVNVNLFQILFMVMLSVVVSVLLESVGVLLISSMMIIPVAAAMKVGWSFKSTTIIAIVFSELSVFFGLWSSHSIGVPSGAAIVSFNVLLLLVVSTIKKLRGNKRIPKDVPTPNLFD